MPLHKYLRSFDLFYQTVKYLKAEQMLHRLKLKPKKLRPLNSSCSSARPLIIPDIFFEKQHPTLKEDGELLEFTYLHQRVTFRQLPDWNYDTNGKLWNYHLQYCDFLSEPQVDFSTKRKLAEDIYKSLLKGKLRPEPYPVSLRSMNTIRWISKNHHSTVGVESVINRGLFSELNHLGKYPEYHLGGNHLMENAFALLMGAHYFRNEKWLHISKSLFERELREQFLDDGAHFERSVMYHQVMLKRMLEAICYMDMDSTLKKRFRDQVPKMVGWLKAMRFKNGDIANFNDSTANCSKETSALIEFADKMNLSSSKSNLNESGFRRVESNSYECIVKTGEQLPAYLPGHIHADTFHFICYVRNQPLITERGISTYESGRIRIEERSTLSHNCVTIDSENTSDVWGSFRMGRRPEVTLLKDEPKNLKMELSFKPFLKSRMIHQREFRFRNSEIMITEKIRSKKKEAEGRLHLHPDVKITDLSGNRVLFDNRCSITFHDSLSTELFEYPYNIDFNKRSNAYGIIYRFRETCLVQIRSEQ